MNVVIFTRDESRAKEIGVEIIDKLYLLGRCVIANNDKTFIFPEKGITIYICLNWSSSVVDLNPRYFLLDTSPTYDFSEFVRQHLNALSNTEEAYSLRNLIMSIIEIALYGMIYKKVRIDNYGRC